jgi:hypothetical protein
MFDRMRIAIDECALDFEQTGGLGSGAEPRRPSDQLDIELDSLLPPQGDSAAEQVELQGIAAQRATDKLEFRVLDQPQHHEALNTRIGIADVCNTDALARIEIGKRRHGLKVLVFNNENDNHSHFDEQ